MFHRGKLEVRIFDANPKLDPQLIFAGFYSEQCKIYHTILPGNRYLGM